MKRTKLDIYSYTDYRQFLEDRLGELKKENPKFSQRYLCRRIGLASNSYLKMIIEGSRNLTDAVFRKLTDALGLTLEETSFFYNLVRFGQAKNTIDREEAFKQLRRSRRFSNIHKLGLDHYDYLTDPLMLALREMINYGDFREDPAWIRSQLTIKATPKQIRDGLKRLQELGLAYRDESNTLHVTNLHTKTAEDLGSTPLRVYHRNILKAAVECMELPVDQRNFHGLTMSIPEEMYGEILEMYMEFVDRVRSAVDGADNSDHVYHMEMLLFPLARRRPSELDEDE